jgi:hypothetical protein
MPAMHKMLNGLIERITYHNAANGFAGLMVKIKGRKDLVTVVDSTASICRNGLTVRRPINQTLILLSGRFLHRRGVRGDPLWAGRDNGRQ